MAHKLQGKEDILSRSEEPHSSYSSVSESLPVGSISSAQDKINLRKFVATFTAMNMLQSDATMATTPNKGMNQRRIPDTKVKQDKAVLSGKD